MHTVIVDSLPSTTPFVGPETLERRIGRPIELRLGANESPFGPSPCAVIAMREQAAISQYYGDPEGYLVRQELSNQLRVPMENIVLGAGIDGLLAECCRIFVNPTDAVVTTLGSYPTFDYGASGCGATIVRIPYRNEAINVDGLVEAAKQSRAKILYLANPDNPSGSWQSPDQIQVLRASLPDECVLLLDEAYFEFAESTLPINPLDPQIIRLRTFSKAHGMAGLRIAYAICHADHANALNKIRMHFGVNSIALAGALASLSDPSHIKTVVSQTEMGRTDMKCFFETFGLRALPSHTNFLTVDVGSRPRAEAILEALLARGVFVRKPGLPPLDGCIRVTIGRTEDRAKFSEIFSDVLRTL